MGKSIGGVSIIGGADGPTSIFIAGKGGKVKLITRIQNYFRKGYCVPRRISLGLAVENRMDFLQGRK